MTLNQITLASINVEKSIAFYQLLGLKLIVEALPKYARLVCSEKCTTLSISKVEATPVSLSTKIYFETDALDDMVKNLKFKGVEFISEPEDKSWLWREAHLHDPDGNPIVIYFAGENRLNPPWRVSE